MIEGVGGPGPLRNVVAGRPRSGERFSAAKGDTVAAVAVGDVASVSLGGMLAMQEAEGDAASDRDARRGGEDMLRELGDLQRNLLGDGASAAGLSRLADLSARAHPAADKGLRGILDAIGLRVRVELARYGADTPGSRKE